MATKALVTLANGDEFQQLLQIALPSLEEFAGRHGYDLLVEPALESSRPPSWHKVPILLACLEQYEEALWVDADMVIVDPSEDLDVPEDAWQALVRHYTGDGEVPNCGLWLVRQPMHDWLRRVWAQTSRMNHGWWEQSALMDLMGYRVDPRPSMVVSPTPLYDHTHWLDNGWNVHVWDQPPAAHPRVRHATMYEDRAAAMREWASA